MSSQSIEHVSKIDKAKVYATLVSAFSNDPVERWLWPDLEQYLASFPLFLNAMGGKAFDEETVWSLDAFAAVALWFPPNVEPDGEAIVKSLTDSVGSDKHADMMAVLEQMDAFHPKYPHWYLPWLGVHANAQGKGLGSEIMKPCLKIVDESHLPAYLETPNPRNISFYERHGFEVAEEARWGSFPPVVFMLRPAH